MYSAFTCKHVTSVSGCSETFSCHTVQELVVNMEEVEGDGGEKGVCCFFPSKLVMEV